MTFKELHSQLRAATLPRLIAALLMILFAAGTQTVLADDVIRVTGKVISKEKRKPLMGVNVQDEKSGRLLATTDEDGALPPTFSATARCASAWWAPKPAPSA